MSLDNIDDLFKELDELEEKDKKPEPPQIIIESAEKDEIISTPRVKTVRIKAFKIPDFNALLKYCERHLDDYEVEQFYKHSLPDSIHQLKFGHKRGGGGWSGVVKATINILIKMKEDGVL